jgi:hypothetical protein
MSRLPRGRAATTARFGGYRHGLVRMRGEGASLRLLPCCFVASLPARTCTVLEDGARRLPGEQIQPTAIC